MTWQPHRHQASLEGVIDLSNLSKDLTPSQRNDGRRRFNAITDHFEAKPGSDTPYSRPRLVRLTHDMALTERSKDNILLVFFDLMGIPLEGAAPIDFDAIEDRFNNFVTSLLENLYLPLRATGGKTPQPTPKLDAALKKLGASHSEVGTFERIGALRGLCLERDRHRCVVTRAFDAHEDTERWKTAGDAACDDEGVPLANEQIAPDFLQVAHILPHTLTKSRSKTDSELDDTRKTTLRLLSMFDDGLSALIDGVDIDQPRNAITLTMSMHILFGQFNLFFEAQPQPNTYRIDAFMAPQRKRLRGLPVTRTLFGAESIDPPSPRFLAVHCAIAHILHLSGAGEYIRSLLRDMDKGIVRGDGATRLDEMVKLRLDGWWDGTVRG